MDSRLNLGLPLLFLEQPTTIKVLTANTISVAGIRKEPDFMMLI
jgi:hypothetical protein